jgi:putative holliday junction resolvase
MTMIVDILAFADIIPKNKRLLGIDVGSKRIGFAISDSLQMVASSLETYQRAKLQALIEKITKIKSEFEICGIVIGFPINMNGTEGPMVDSIRGFAKNIDPFFDIPIVLWDERLSTFAVTRSLEAAGMSRNKRQKVVDKLAAAYILQGCLDRLRLRSSQNTFS